MPPLVSAIVLTTWTPADALRCVDALKKQTIADQIEILVTENHSEDDSVGILRTRLNDIPNVRIIETPKNRGYGSGNNYASRYASGKYLLIINPDNEPEPGAIQAMAEAMERDPSIGILAPRLVFPDGSVRDSARRFPDLFDVIIKRTFLQHVFRKRLARYLRSDVPPSPFQEVDWVVGAVLFLRLDFFRFLGGFDERFFLFFEDMDLCRRCRLAGRKVVYAPAITVRDGKERLSGGGVFSLLRKRTGRAHIASAIRYFWKWGTAHEESRAGSSINIST